MSGPCHTVQTVLERFQVRGPDTLNSSSTGFDKLTLNVQRHLLWEAARRASSIITSRRSTSCSPCTTMLTMTVGVVRMTRGSRPHLHETVRFWKLLLLYMMLTETFCCQAKRGGVYNPSHILYQASSPFALRTGEEASFAVYHLPFETARLDVFPPCLPPVFVVTVVCNFHEESYWSNNHCGNRLCTLSNV
jgi:hypothetical protein